MWIQQASGDAIIRIIEFLETSDNAVAFVAGTIAGGGVVIWWRDVRASTITRDDLRTMMDEVRREQTRGTAPYEVDMAAALVMARQMSLMDVGKETVAIGHKQNDTEARMRDIEQQLARLKTALEKEIP